MKKYKLLSCVGIGIILLIIVGLFLWGSSSTVDIHVHYDFSAVEESNVKKITIKRNDCFSDIVSNAEAIGFAWDEDREKMELKEGTGDVIIHGKENELIAFRINYNKKDDMKSIAGEQIEVCETVNNERAKEEMISLNQFTDRHYVYLRLPMWIKAVLILMILMVVVSVVGIIYDIRNKRIKNRDSFILKGEEVGNGDTLCGERINNAKKRARTVFVLLIVFLVAAVMLIRAHIAPFTWDESRSAEQYIAGLDLTRPQSIITIFAGSTANNHLLNSILGSIVVHTIGIYYDEFILRIPNLFIAILGLIYFARRTIRGKMTILCFSLLSLCYYMNKFWGLERGYGMANVLVGIALCEWYDYLSDNLEKNDKCIFAFLLLTFASAANTVTLLLTITISLMTIVCMAQKKRFISFLTQTWMYLVPIGLLNFFLLLYHFYVSYNDDSLFSGKEGFPVTEMISSFVEGYVGEHAVLIAAGTILFGAILIGDILLRVMNKKRYLSAKRNGVGEMTRTSEGLNEKKRDGRTLPERDSKAGDRNNSNSNSKQGTDTYGQNGYSVWSLVAFLALTLIASIVVGKGYPVKRALVPIYPLFVFALESCIFDIESVIASRIPVCPERKTCFVTAISGIIAGILVILFCHQISFAEILHEDESIREIAYQAMVTPEIDREKLVKMNHPMPFYYRQIKEKYQFDIFIGKKITE